MALATIPVDLIAPPAGFRAAPDYLVCPEMRTCVALIFPQIQVGM
jgi:hypothetical protein